MPLPPDVERWLRDPEVESVVLRPDGVAWVRFADRTERRTVGPVDAELFVRPRLVGIDADAEVVRGGSERVLRLVPHASIPPGLPEQQRAGRLLPEVRTSIEEAIRSHRGVLVASAAERRGGALFEGIVQAWQQRGWVHRLPLGATARDVAAARRLRPDVVVAEYPERAAWRALWLTDGPFVARIRAPSSGRALRLIASWTALGEPPLPLEVARELVIAHVDLVVEEEADGRARGTWRVLPDPVPSVEFVAGTKSRLTESTPPEAAGTQELPVMTASPRPRATTAIPRTDSLRRRVETRPHAANSTANGRGAAAPDAPPALAPGAASDEETPDLFRITEAPQPHRSGYSGPPTPRPEPVEE